MAQPVRAARLGLRTMIKCTLQGGRALQGWMKMRIVIRIIFSSSSSSSKRAACVQHG
jgi:hypothetical protein